MDIVYAAEKPSIAETLSDHLSHRVSEKEIEVCANPNETGSFFVKWQLNRYLLTPSGRLVLKGILQS